MTFASRNDPPEFYLVASRPVRERGYMPGGLPASLTSFIGRESETADLAALLRDPGVRLITLTGPGGVGKTRLAIQVAETVLDDFEDGVWFVPLAAIRDPVLVPVSIARALGLRTAGGPDVGTALGDYLRLRQLLLVLDNFEHLLDARTLIAELLQIDRALKVLVTSRSVLRLYGEHRFPVQPMPVVPSGSVTRFDVSRLSPAVMLFCERAAAADGRFELTVDNAPAVAEICQRLEGLPLAIELAASRTDVLTPEAMIERLEPVLPLLVGGNQGQPERFVTMRSTIAWSYDLLSPSEQWLLRNLAVFAGAFTIDAVESVARAFEGADDEDEAALDRISALVEQSLLQRAESGSEPRFSMLEVIREFCFEELAASGELDEARRRHAACCLAVVRELTPGMSGAETAANLERLEIELPNIRAALSWLFEHEQFEAALQLANALYSFWGYRGHLHEGQGWLLKILDRGGTSTRVRVDGLLAVCGSFAFQGDHVQALRVRREAADLAKSDRYPFGQAMAHLYRGIIADWEGNFGEAAAIYAQCAERIGEFGAAHWPMRVLALQAEMDVLLDNVTRGEQRAREAMASARESGYFWIAGSAAGVLAYLHLTRWDLASAAQLYHENLVRYQSVGHLRGMSGALAGFAGVASECGQKETAARLMGAAHATLAEIGAAHLKNKGLSDRIETRVRASMSGSAFRAASDVGYALGREWACAEAQALRQTVDGAKALAPPAAAAKARLTRREVDVLYLLARRLTDKEIADALSISHRTAMHHVSNILSKLQLESRRQVPEWAEQHGFVEAGFIAGTHAHT